MTDKKHIRKTILASRNALSGRQIESMSRRIFERFTRLDEARICSTMMAFLHFGTEVITDTIIAWGWREGKRVAVPLCQPETKQLIISAIETFDDVEPGYFGVREPKKHLLKPLEKSQIDLVLVPGVAFDRRGYRVGYGGGYYDRFLSAIGKDVPKIGLVFASQLIEAVPADSHDLPVDKIITEEEVIVAGSN
ncbi:MAG: 5-formyltetrahydrofolate cyclo-ligase [Deltaproteobacteria bacterium]|nr:5-formyltetrahydrofolate cyclo-ligase [Deltaproteobacteria bacterium]